MPLEKQLERGLLSREAPGDSVLVRFGHALLNTRPPNLVPYWCQGGFLNNLCTYLANPVAKPPSTEPEE